MANRPIGSLLEQLSSAAAENAWNEFLEDFGPLILCVVRKCERDDDRVNDCFLYICEELSRDGFRRLRRFQPDGPALFRTWRLVTLLAGIMVVGGGLTGLAVWVSRRVTAPLGRFSAAAVQSSRPAHPEYEAQWDSAYAAGWR